MLMFEVPGEHVEVDGKPAPMTISREYTLSLSEKANLRHDLESWRGRQFTIEELKGFQVEKVLGQPCMLSVIHKTSGKGKVYATISNIAGMPKGVEAVPQWHKPVSYEIEEGESPAFKLLPAWIQNKIKACEEWATGGEAEPEAETSPESFEEPPF